MLVDLFGTGMLIAGSENSEHSHSLWGEAAVQMSTFGNLSGIIRRALDNDGYIKDAASPLLGRLRRSFGEQERVVRQETNRAMSEARARGWVTADEVTLRGDRFCLPLRSGDVRRVDGIIHDRSATGATLFLEPAGVVRLSNQLTETRLEIAAEEARILFELNSAAEKASPALREAAEVMLLVHECLGILHEIGIKLSKVLRMHQPSDGRLKEPAPVESNVLKGKSFQIPYENKKIKSKTDLNGKTIAEAFSFIISACFLACVFFQDKYTISLLDREKGVNDEIRLKLAMLERITAPEMYSKLKKQFLL